MMVIDAHGRHKYKQKSLLPETRLRRTSSTRPSALTTVEKVTLCYIKSCKQLQGGNIHNTPNVVRQRSFRWTDITYSASSKLVYLWVRCFILGKESRSDLSELIDVLFFLWRKKQWSNFFILWLYHHLNHHIFFVSIWIVHNRTLILWAWVACKEWFNTFVKAKSVKLKWYEKKDLLNCMAV